MSNLQLNGQYFKSNSTLTSKNNILLIGKRKNPTAKKPENYLLIQRGKKYHYVSSLYPLDESQSSYKFDYANKSYTYSQLGDEVTIKCTF